MSNGHDIQKTPTANSALAKARTSRMSTSSTTLFLAILAAVLIVLPFVASDYWIDVCVFWGINALLSLSSTSSWARWASSTWGTAHSTLSALTPPPSFRSGLA